MWHHVSTCSIDNVGEDRLVGAGLSTSGSKSLVVAWDNLGAVAWDVEAGRVLWSTDDPASTLIPDGAFDGSFVRVAAGEVGGRYRMFGPFEWGTGRTVDPSSGRVLELHAATQTLIVRTGDGGEECRLKYDAFGDWACASFSDDGRVIAVLDPYYASFFVWRDSPPEQTTADV